MFRSNAPANEGLFKFILSVGDTPQNRPIIDAVAAYTSPISGAVNAEDVRRVALEAARDAFGQEGQAAPTDDEVIARAYEAITIAAIEQPFVLAEDDRSPAKAVHYFVSGAIAAKLSACLPMLPAKARHGIGFNAAHAIGVLKEVADQIKGTGFNPRDVQTDDAGAHGALDP